MIRRIISLWPPDCIEAWFCASEFDFWELMLNFYPIWSCLFRTLLISSVGRAISYGPWYSTKNWIRLFAHKNLPSISNPMKSSSKLCCHFSIGSREESKSWIRSCFPLSFTPVCSKLYVSFFFGNAIVSIIKISESFWVIVLSLPSDLAVDFVFR